MKLKRITFMKANKFLGMRILRKFNIYIPKN